MQTQHGLIDALFAGWQERLGPDYVPYRNHVYRVFNLAAALAEAQGEDLEKMAVAAAFHDVGIWLDGTFDYLGPSIQRASGLLTILGRESWIAEVDLMIRHHHKITPWRGSGTPLVEAFRRADWLDISFFALPTGLSRTFLHNLLETFPREGFNRRVTAIALQWALQHPLRPLPMFQI